MALCRPKGEQSHRFGQSSGPQGRVICVETRTMV
jgi:hypothetical protein